MSVFMLALVKSSHYSCVKKNRKVELILALTEETALEREALKKFLERLDLSEVGGICINASYGLSLTLSS